MRPWKGLVEKVAAALTATAFAEEGEPEAARRILAQAGTPPADGAPPPR